MMSWRAASGVGAYRGARRCRAGQGRLVLGFKYSKYAGLERAPFSVPLGWVRWVRWRGLRGAYLPTSMRFGLGDGEVGGDGQRGSVRGSKVDIWWWVMRWIEIFGECGWVGGGAT